MIRNKTNSIHKAFFAILFVVFVLFVSGNANFIHKEGFSENKVEILTKQRSSGKTVFSSVGNVNYENQTDFEEIEGDDFHVYLFSSLVKTINCFDYKNISVNYFADFVSFFKLPFYILFCNLKIHLIR
jgi:hypothetical protein